MPRADVGFNWIPLLENAMVGSVAAPPERSQVQVVPEGTPLLQVGLATSEGSRLKVTVEPAPTVSIPLVPPRKFRVPLASGSAGPESSTVWLRSDPLPKPACQVQTDGVAAVQD